VDESGEITIPLLVDNCILSKGVEIQELLGVRKEAVLYIQPCASERGKLMADIELSQEIDVEFFDPKVLCSLLEIHRKRFAELRCSSSLGVAKVKWRGRDMSVFKNGKLKIQRAPTREEILKMANAMSRLVWGAILCEVCGEPGLSCASGECGKCRQGETSAKLREVPGGELLRRALDFLKMVERNPKEMEKYSQKAKYFALYFVEEAPDKGSAVAGLALLAEADRMVVANASS
jgi:hypothetical protein